MDDLSVYDGQQPSPRPTKKNRGKTPRSKKPLPETARSYEESPRAKHAIATSIAPDVMAGGESGDIGVLTCLNRAVAALEVIAESQKQLVAMRTSCDPRSDAGDFMGNPLTSATELNVPDSRPRASSRETLLTAKDVAAILKFHVQTVRKLIREGKLGATKDASGRWLVSQRNIAAFQRAHSLVHEP